jgi:hypothetical protein
MGRDRVVGYMSAIGTESVTEENRLEDNYNAESLTRMASRQYDRVHVR